MSTFAAYEDFSNQLNMMGIDVKKIESQSSISRYDLARLLNIVECKDCINPDQEMMNKYVQSFWSQFTAQPGKDFADISYRWWIYNNLSYYYCIAYVGDNSYMRGYPKATSPVCWGKFCGTKDTTTAEFLQVVINIIAKYIAKDLNLNRKNVDKRVNNLKADSYEAKNFTSNDKTILSKRSKECENICALQNKEEVNLYLKYCMFNLNACNMKEIGKIKEGYRPVAELNLLANQNIIDIDQSLRKNIDKNIDGKTVLQTLFHLNDKVNCAFNNDYDCDSIENTKDKCPNTYNPHQRDTDNDNIGDVCDDDIDGDDIKNPIGIVDDQGKIDISKRTKDIDNCLFIINTDQEDTNNDNIWNACQDIGNEIGIYITLDKLEGIAPLTTTFIAKTTGIVYEVHRDFGDGTQGNGREITHTFLSPGMYNIQATAKGSTTDAQAQIIVIVGGQRNDDKALQTRASRIGGASDVETTLSASLVGTFDEIERYFAKENIKIKKAPQESIQRIFTYPGENPVIVKGYRNNELMGISYFTIGVGEGRWAILKSSVGNPEINQKVLLNTDTYNIKQDDIMKVERDFGDETKQVNTTLTIEHTYTKAGKRVITQTITLTDGKKLTNMLTLNIIDKSVFASYALLMTPDTLITSIWGKINFSAHIIGNLLKTPINQVMEFSDGSLQTKPWTEKMPNLFTHTYQKNGILTPQDSMYIDQCTYLKNQATIAIQGTDICLNGKIQNTLNKIYACDLDKDNIPDICDSDIDGDDIPNLLGLINTENKNCSYESDPNKPNANINQEILAKHYQWICSLDNAPFNANPDQLDLNQDGIGDIQETRNVWTNKILDTDGDGIPDTTDLCPNIQETWNGITDEDGCPEVGQEIGCDQQLAPLIGITNDTLIVKPTTCNQCPCQFGDFASDLTNNDQIRAVLRDKKKTIQYKFSSPWIVDFSIL